MKIPAVALALLLLSIPASAQEDPVKAAYQAARAHYKAGDNERACLEFGAIARDHPTHPVAVYAAHLHLDCLNLTKQYEELGRAAARYLKKSRIRDPEFIGVAAAVLQSVRFKRCDERFAKGTAAEEAARCFSDFADAFPKSRHADKALFNAAVAYARAGREASAARAYQRLVRAYPDSPLGPKALFALAMLQQKAGQRDEAARSFEKLAARYPEMREAADATLNAAMLCEKLGAWAKAEKLYDRYLARYAREERDQGAAIAFHLAQALEKKGERRKAAARYAAFLKDHEAHAPLRLRLRARLQLVKLSPPGRERGARDRARAELDAIAKIHAAAPQRNDPALAAVVAEARFLRLELDFEDLQRSAGGLGSLAPVAKACVPRKQEYLRLRQGYMDLIRLRSPEWTLAALYKMGRLMELLASELRHGPCAKADQAKAFQGKAALAYRVVIQRAEDLKLDTPAVKAAREALRKLNLP